jgi:uncharacterized LabA/DUF88 family protein
MPKSENSDKRRPRNPKFAGKQSNDYPQSQYIEEPKDSRGRSRPSSSPSKSPRQQTPQKSSLEQSQQAPLIAVPQQRVALFIDGINLWYAQQKLNYRIDYIKLRDYWIQRPGYTLYNAFFYTGHHNQPDEDKQQFLDMLINNGYTLRTKNVKIMYDHVSKRDVYKCNLDVEIVIDMLVAQDLYDIAILISGDGDFERLVETLRIRGKQVYASCCRAMTAKDLLASVDKFYWLEDLRGDLEYKGGSPLKTEKYEEEIFSKVQL